jgi:hypothetical protein
VGPSSSNPIQVTPLGPAEKPAITSIVRGDSKITLNFTAGSNGGDNTATYTATSTPAVRSWVGSNSQIVADGLTPGVDYKFIITTVTRVSNIMSDETSSIRALTNPVVVTNVTAKKGSGGAVISFNSGNNVAESSLLYTVTSIPDNKKATGITSPITIEGLTNGTSYTFTIVTSNDIGSSLESTPSNSIIPSNTLDILNSYNIIKDINHFINHIETNTFTENIAIILADMTVDMSLAAGGAIKGARHALIKYIFEEKSNLSSFQVDRNEIGIVSTTTKNKFVLIVKPSTSSSAAPLEIDSILDSNVSVYADLPNIGSINKFLISKEILTVTKIGLDEFLFINGTGVITTHKSGEIIIYNGRTIEFGSILISNIIETYEPLTEMICDGAAPYNATNFTPANGVEFNRLVRYANTQPQYPWATGSDAQQIFRSKQDITYFTYMNQATAVAHTNNTEYPRFNTQGERLMYINGMSLTAARNQITGTNPSAPAGVPCSTIYQIINS